MTLLSLFKNTNNNNPHTLIWGADDFLNDYLVRSYAKEDRFKDLEHVTVDCESDGLDELIASLTESSLFSEQKFIVVKNPFFLTAKVSKKLQKQIDDLQKIFENLADLEDVVVIVASYEKIDRRKKLTKTVLKQFNVVEPQIRPYEVASTTKALIKDEGYIITQSALQLLIERSDQVIDTILSNYQKLKMVATDNKITEKSVMQNVDLSLAQNIFAILESALDKNYREAVERLDNQLREGTNPIQLLAVFENQLELILVVKILAQRGRSEPQIVKELGVHPYRVKLALRNRLKIEKLENLLRDAIDLEFKYKNGTYREDNFLKLFILNV
ncbi:DNA polymerase III subunit delta [Lactobacillus crispatus]|uniref:DNA polymerase III subunit delta n=1 Tax=Lactobacillus crispatus TaxID=47770 RepID=A0A5M9Z6K0_9LACO|nr:DNA polymerase III subunit delta [Lactobacillus crispatus]KAA8813649.1 DNA polymerase III subunit delta [Lactobacillus crispatus]KRK35552.1 DNA-directed DNA polymerase III delta subunit [Lactobacillus crispatus DSM 20584 = JCM 1185 = ATCC 33820]MBW9142433.1 DNA polymerase III subunit delta [Lactobacillus crispatus]ORE87617.1 DNA polymerase III subunit delta [Lactobacillus crispatus]QWW28253.1 DNA polymerase III subunit delta [Lactobacillus crispatus]